MRRIRILSCLLVLIFQANLMQAIAAEADAGQQIELSLEAAISSAISNNPQIAAAQSRLAGAEQRLARSWSGFFPQLNASEGFQRTTNPMWAFGLKLNQASITTQDFNPDLLNDPSAMDNYATQVWLSWPIFDSGRTWYGWRQAGMASQAEESALSRTRQEVISQAVSAYTDLVLARNCGKVVDQALSTAQAHLTMIEKRYENGLVVKSDVLQTKVHIAELEQDKVNADNRIAIAVAALNAVMGKDMNLGISPETPLSQTKIEAKPLDDWIDSALAHRPDLAQMKLQEQAAATEIKKSKTAFLPSVSLNGGYEWDTQDFGNMADNYTVGANVTLNLFSGGSSLSQTREAVSRKEEISAQIRGAKQKIRLETEKAYRDVLGAEKRIAAASSAVDQADEALRIVRNRYESGLLPVVSLLDAELAAYRSNNNYYQALKDHMQARASLALAVGELDEGFH